MLSSQNYETYKKVDIETASQGRLIVMLYEGAIRRVEEAIKQLGNNRLDAVNNNLVKGQEIVGELRSSLNMEAGEIAKNLDRVYEYMQHRMMMANIRKDKAMMEESVRLLTMLHDTWKKLFEGMPESDLREATSAAAQANPSVLNLQG